MNRYIKYQESIQCHAVVIALLLLCLVVLGIIPWWIWSSYALGRGPGSKGESAI